MASSNSSVSCPASSPRSVRRLRAGAVLALVLGLTGAMGVTLSGCGGPLSVVAEYDASKVSGDEKSKVEAAEKTAGEAKKKVEEAEEALSKAEDALSKAEKAIDGASGAVSVAEANLELQKAKDSAKQGGDVAGAETEIKHKKHDLVVAKAERELAAAERVHKQKLLDEATKAWVVALAEVEVQKHAAMKASGAEADKKKASLDEQLADKKSDYAKAQKATTEAGEDLDKAKEKLSSAKSSE